MVSSSLLGDPKRKNIILFVFRGKRRKSIISFTFVLSREIKKKLVERGGFSLCPVFCVHKKKIVVFQIQEPILIDL